jgi:hypothetical protein
MDAGEAAAKAPRPAAEGIDSNRLGDAGGKAQDVFVRKETVRSVAVCQSVCACVCVCVMCGAG